MIAIRCNRTTHGQRTVYRVYTLISEPLKTQCNRALLSRYRYAVPTVLHSEYYLVLLPKYSIGSINGICADRSISVKSIQVYYLNLKRQEN